MIHRPKIQDLVGVMGAPMVGFGFTSSGYICGPVMCASWRSDKKITRYSPPGNPADTPRAMFWRVVRSTIRTGTAEHNLEGCCEFQKIVRIVRIHSQAGQISFFFIAGLRLSDREPPLSSCARYRPKSSSSFCIHAEPAVDIPSKSAEPNLNVSVQCRGLIAQKSQTIIGQYTVMRALYSSADREPPAG